MTQPELDRVYTLIMALTERLDGMKGEEAQSVVGDLRKAQDVFAHQTACAWVAIVCEDYACPNTGAPCQILLPVSRFRRIESAFPSYGFGWMHFSVVKRGGRIRGIRLKADQDFEPNVHDKGPFEVSLNPGDELQGHQISFGVFLEKPDAEAWLQDQPGISFEASVQITLDRLTGT